MGKEIEIDDIVIYRGDVYKSEKDRKQIVTSIDVNGSFFTKFMDTDDLNIVNTNSGYFEQCEIILRKDNNYELPNGLPFVWDSFE